MKKKKRLRSNNQAKEMRVKNSIWKRTKVFFIYLYPAFLVAFLPILITNDHWLRVWKGGLPRAWDGTGHYAVAQIYANEIFPDTFGWIDNFFAGMSFPNFYPPLFYWLIALLSKIGIFSFLTSFKIIVCLPLILMPLAFWFLAWRISERSRAIATFSALASVWLLIDYRFTSAAFPLGLDYFSTFHIGLYAQPLGFILLLAWLFVYQDENPDSRKIGVAALLLALVILANFFCAMTACVFIFAHLVNDFSKFIFKGNSFSEFRRKIFVRLSVPILAVCLSAFWLVPMLNQSKYFVTRPTPVSIFPSKVMWLFYALAFFGCVVWLKKREAEKFYVIACVCLGIFIFLAPLISPSWFPFQTNRFLANFNFLLCLPVAFFLDFVLENTSQAFFSMQKPAPSNGVFYLCALTACGLLHFWLIESPKYELSFYTDKEFGRIKPILDFAQTQTQGRYLVENPDPNYPVAQLDGRAINSYLGMQGNKTANIVFREASPSSLFFNPLVSVFSAHPENYGISSVLADDLDFKEQPFEKHLEQAKFLGIRHFVIISPWIKEKLVKANLTEHKFGAWSVFEIEQGSFSDSQNLNYKPALVISDFSLKARKNDDFNFIRLAEEQFSDAWFDVLLVHNPQNNKIDRLTDLENFGAIIVEKYDYDDENQAFDILKTYSQENLVVLFNSENNLLRRIKTSTSEFANLEIIDYPIEQESHWLENEYPSTNYNSSKIRATWMQIKISLESHKVQKSVDSNLIQIKRTFHPNRQYRTTSYLSTPFFTVASTSENERLVLKRVVFEIFALCFSIISLFFCFLLIFKRVNHVRQATSLSHTLKR
jgi:hypothetical protein